MYWNGYYNSGKGINDWGSWGSLPDREWESNGKYDTCLYEVDITTGEATRLSKIDKRWIFSCLWVDGDDCSDGASIDVTAIKNVKTLKTDATSPIYNLQGQRVENAQKGFFIQNGKKFIVK